VKMVSHPEMVIAVLFINIFVSLGASDLTLGQNPFFEQTDTGNYQFKGNVTQPLQNSDVSQNPSFLKQTQQVFSGIFVIADFIGALFVFLTSSLWVLSVLPPVVQVIFGIPLFLMHALALIDFLRH